MSRAVVRDAIINDNVLGALFREESAPGENDSNVLPNYDGEQRPSDEMFMVLRWDTDTTQLRGDDSTVRRGPKGLNIWVHMWREFSTDFNKIDRVIDRLDFVLSNIIDTPGTDGQTVSQIIVGDKSRDLKDDVYQTYCRSSSYQVFSRAT